eukprot:363547-Chlamydomonas_euryale.AAC.1
MRSAPPATTHVEASSGDRRAALCGAASRCTDGRHRGRQRVAEHVQLRLYRLDVGTAVRQHAGVLKVVARLCAVRCQ